MPQHKPWTPCNQFPAATKITPINATLMYHSPRGKSPNKNTYHAILATIPLGHLLHHHFLTSSVNNNQSPNATGKKKYSTGILLELIALSRPGIYKKMKMTTSAKRIAGNRARFCVALLKIGGCWKMERRRVRVAIKLNLEKVLASCKFEGSCVWAYHCMITKLTK